MFWTLFVLCFGLLGCLNVEVSVWICGWFWNSFGRVSLDCIFFGKFKLITVWIRMSELGLWLLFELETIALVELLLIKHSFFSAPRASWHIFISMSHKRSLIVEEKLVGRRMLFLSNSVSNIYLIPVLSVLLNLTAVLTHVDTIVLGQFFCCLFHHHWVLMTH